MGRRMMPWCFRVHLLAADAVPGDEPPRPCGMAFEQKTEVGLVVVLVERSACRWREVHVVPATTPSANLTASLGVLAMSVWRAMPFIGWYGRLPQRLALSL
jgi:hypothetical protein